MIGLKNEKISVQVDTLGAELGSMKNLETGYEAIWQGDAAFWTGHSPVLFPLVGWLNNGVLRCEGQEYTMGNHGFARRSTFEVVRSSDVQAVFRLSSNEETLKMYPYAFQLDLTYTLAGTQLTIDYQVTNSDQKPIYFLLGTHPAFNCPFEQGEALTDYYVEFEKKETLDRYFATSANTILVERKEPVLQDENILELTPEMFYEGAYIFKNVKSSAITLKSKKSEGFIKVSYENFPYMGIWQPKDAPFICLEPWHGIGDAVDFNGTIDEKEMIVKLETGKTWYSKLVIEMEI